MLPGVCPFCGSGQAALFHQDRRRSYWRCANCALVYVPPAFYLSIECERAEYDLHQNAIDDPGYRRFLSRLAEPLCAQLSPKASGLDFGCGPGPALAAMLREAGFCVTTYDPFYAADEAALQQSYDFICATEVVEHLHRPGEVWDTLWNRLNSGGVLAIMTKLVSSRRAFGRWHYINDPTHVVFFSRQTIDWWAKRHDTYAHYHGADVVFLHKPN